MTVNLVPGCNSEARQFNDQHVVLLMEDYYNHGNFFKLLNLFERHQDQLSKKDKLYFSALINNSFYRHSSSNISIDKLLKKHSDKLTDNQLKNIHKAKFMNHYNLYEYDEAYVECLLLISDYEQLLEPAAYKHLFNDKKILGVLRDAAPQKISKTDDSRIGLKRDKMGLLNIALQMNGDSIDFLFDTGSSFSFIKRSIAEAESLKIFDVDFEVEGATGAVVVCDLAIVDNFTIGNIIIENAVFWVFDDKDVTLPEYDYSVNGAIAFPILKSMEEIQIIFNDTLVVPRFPEKHNFKNLAIKDLDPVIAVFHNGDTLPFYFDTGSAFSSFYKPYYDKNADKIDTTYEMKSFNIGSLGGVKEFTCYIIDSMELGVGHNYAMIRDIETHTDYIYKEPEKVYGNLGQDYILQFEKMVISTKYASVYLE